MDRTAHETAVLGGGCFWCLDAVFRELDGVTGVESGYAGGTTERPGYDAVCSGTTGHAEVVRVSFDPSVLSYRDLLAVFFAIHDPTTRNRQGHDIGTQYRSGIYVYDDVQRAAAESSAAAYGAKLQAAGYPAITTEILDVPEFYFAEDYHQQYLAKNPGGYCGIGGTGVSCPVGLATAAG